MLSDEQMSNGYPFFLLKDEQMSNKVGVEHQPDGVFVARGDFQGGSNLLLRYPCLFAAHQRKRVHLCHGDC